MNNLERLKNGLTTLYLEHGVRNGYTPATIHEMIKEIDFFALYQTLRICGDRKNVYRYLAYYNDYCGYQSDPLFHGEVVEIYTTTDYRSCEGDCLIRHKIELVVREDMSLATLICCETEIGNDDYTSEYRDVRKEWPVEIAIIDIDVLHRNLKNFYRGFDEDEYLFFEP